MALIASSLMFYVGNAFSGIGTTVAVSSELGTSIASKLFPASVDLTEWNLFLTEPELIFIDDQRLGMQVRFQAYDHRPSEGVARSEMGWALFSGILGYDLDSRQILLHEPSLDKLDFDRDTEVTRLVSTHLMAAWSTQVTDPVRSDIPPHPYILPFLGHIQDLSYDGKTINITISYQ